MADETEKIDKEPIDDDDYNETVKLVTQEEENQENNCILSVIKLPPKIHKRGCSKELAIGLLRKKSKLAPVTSTTTKRIAMSCRNGCCRSSDEKENHN